MVGSSQVCGPSNLGGLKNNTFISIQNSHSDDVVNLDNPKGNTCDSSPPVKMTVAQVEALAHKLVGL
jgi:hypothetical protein